MLSRVSRHKSAPLKHVEVSSQAWFFMNRLKKHGDASAHDHNYLELAFVLDGKARHYTVSGESPSCRGDIYIIPVGAWHGYAGCRGLEIVNCMLSPSLLQKELAWMAEDSGFRSLLGLGEPRGCAGIRSLKMKGPNLVKLKGALIMMHNAYSRQAERAELLGYLLLLLNLIRQTADDKGLNRETIGVHPSVRQALKRLHENPALEWTLPRLALELHLNPSYLVRLFRLQTGLSPMKYLAKLRAEKAATLLLSGKASVGEIGLQSGWPEPKHFARSFRQHFGISASAYRKKMLKPFLGKNDDAGLPGLRAA